MKPIVPHPNITDKKSLDIRNLPTSKSQANAWETGSDEEKDDLDIPDRSFWSRGDRPMPGSHWRSGNTQSPLDQRARFSQRSADNPDTKPNFEFPLFPKQGNAERVRWAREMPKSPAQNFGERRQSFEGSQDKERNARNSILGAPPHLSVQSPAQNFDDPRKSSLLGFPPHFHKNSIAQSFEDTRNSSSSILGAPPPLNTGYRKSDDQHQSYVPYQSSASHRDPRSEKSIMESRSPAVRPDWRAQYSMNSPRYTGMSPRPSQSSWTPRGSSSSFVNNRSSWSRNTDPRESPNTDWSKNVEPWMGENRNVYAPNVPVRKTSAPLTYGQYLAMKKEQEAAKKAAEEKLKVAEEEVNEKEKKDVDDKSVRDPRLRAKSPETFVSPLGDVTYSNLPAPKTGRGYGPQVAYRPRRPTLTETKPIEPPIKPTLDEKQALSTKESKLSQDMKDDERSLVIDELGPQKNAAFESKEETKNDKDINKEDTQEASNENTTSVHFAEKAKDVTFNPTKEKPKAQEKVSSDFIEEKSDKEGVEVSEQKQEDSPSLASRGNIVGDVCEPSPVSTNNRPIQEGPTVEAERIQDSRDLKHAPVDTPDSTTHDLFESSSSVQVESSANVENATSSPVTDTAVATEEENPLLLLPNNVMLKILASDKEMIKNFMSLLQKKKKRHSSSSSSEESSSCSSSSSSSSEEEKGKLESKHKKKKKRKKKKKKKKRKIKLDNVGASSALSVPVCVAATQPRIMTNPAESDLNKPLELIDLENFKISKNMFNAPQNDFSDNEEEDVSFSLNDVISKSSLFDKDEDQPVSDEASKTDESSAEKSNENELKQSNETNFEQSEKTAEQSNETTLERNQSNQTALEFLDSLTEEESQREIESEKNNHSELKQFEEIASHQSYETALEKSNELALDETSETVLEQSNETSLGQSDKTTSEKDKEITLNYSSAPTSELDESNQEQRQREIELEESKDKPVSKHTKNKWTELDRLHSDLMENFKDIANISSVRACRKKQSETPSPPSNRVSPIKSDEKKTLDKIEESGTESQLNTSKEDDVSDYAETKTPSQAKKITKKKKKSLGFGSKKRPKKKIAKPAEPSSDKVASHKAAVEKADELSSEDTENITTPQEISAVEAQTTTSKPTKTKRKAGPKSRKSKRTLRKPSEEIVPPQALTEKLDYLSSEDFDSETVASLRDGSAVESNRSTFKSPPTKIKRGKRSPSGPLRRSLRSTVPVSEEKPKTTSEASDSESVEDSEKESVVTGNEMESDLSDVEQPALESILSKKPGPKSKTRSCYFGNVPIQQPIILLDNLDSREANRVVSALGKTPSEKSGEINNELDPAIFNDVEYFQTDGPTNCKLCAKKFTSKIILTQHYKHVHPNCNIVPSSRFSKEVAQLVKSKSEQEELEYLENVDIIEGNFPLSRQKYGQKMRMYSCHFCDYKKVSKFGAYLTHVSFHTGEYRYKCPLNCFFTTNYKKSMKTHFKDQHAESGKEVMECYKPIDYQMDLFGYLCKVCNYVQLLKSNMRRHFVLGHKDIDNVDACIIRIDMSGHSVTAKPDLGDADSRFPDFEFPELDDNDSTDCDDNNLVGSSLLNKIMQDLKNTRPGEVSSEVLNMNLLDDEAFPEEGTRSEQSKESVLKSTKQTNAAHSMDRNFETEKHLKSQSIEQIVASFEDLDKKSKSSDVTTKDSVEAKALNKSTIPPFKNSHDEKLDIEPIINTNTHSERSASANNKENNIDIGESQKKEKQNLLSKLREKMSANINVPETDDEKSGKETKVVETEIHNSKLIEQTKPTVLEKERLDVSQESSTVEKVTTVIPSPQTPSTSKPPGFNSPRLSGRKSFNEPQIAATLKKLEIKREPSDSPLGTIQYTDEERRKMWLDQMNSFYQKETLYRPNAELRENLSKLLSKKLLPDESPQKESQKGSTSKAPPKVIHSEIPSHDHDYSSSKGTLPVQPLSTALSTLRQRKLPERNCKLNVIVPEEEDLEDEVSTTRVISSLRMR